MVSARRRLIFKECQRSGFADVAMYAKPVGKQRIRGLSIRFAEAAIRHFTNVLTQVAVVFDDERRRILHVSVIDLETERDLRRGRSRSTLQWIVASEENRNRVYRRRWGD